MKHKDLNPNKIFVYGKSLGGGVAIHLGSKFGEKIKGTILENTFCSVSDLVDFHYPILKYLKSFLLKLKWENAVKIKDLKCPLLIFTWEKDEIVPYKNGLALY